MAKPTILSPWYVIQRVRDDGTVSGDYHAPEFFCSQEIADESWTTEPKQAMLFMSLHSAARVAVAEAAHIRVLINTADAEEFGR